MHCLPASTQPAHPADATATAAALAAALVLAAQQGSGGQQRALADTVGTAIGASGGSSVAAQAVAWAYAQVCGGGACSNGIPQGVDRRCRCCLIDAGHPRPLVALSLRPPVTPSLPLPQAVSMGRTPDAAFAIARGAAVGGAQASAQSEVQMQG
jgi:hypothetical protein